MSWQQENLPMWQVYKMLRPNNKTITRKLPLLMSCQIVFRPSLERLSPAPTLFLLDTDGFATVLIGYNCSDSCHIYILVFLSSFIYIYFCGWNKRISMKSKTKADTITHFNMGQFLGCSLFGRKFTLSIPEILDNICSKGFSLVASPRNYLTF